MQQIKDKNNNQNKRISRCSFNIAVGQPGNFRQNIHQTIAINKT